MVITDSKTTLGYQPTAPRLAQDDRGVWHVRGYAEARELLRHDLLQMGFGAEEIRRAGLSPVLYQQGEAHRQQRANLARFFSPTSVSQNHRQTIERLADETLAPLRHHKQADLNALTVQMAASVAAAIVGLAVTPGLVKRLDAMLHAPPTRSRR